MTSKQFEDDLVDHILHPERNPPGRTIRGRRVIVRLELHVEEGEHELDSPAWWRGCLQWAAIEGQGPEFRVTHARLEASDETVERTLEEWYGL